MLKRTDCEKPSFKSFILVYYRVFQVTFECAHNYSPPPRCFLMNNCQMMYLIQNEISVSTNGFQHITKNCRTQSSSRRVEKDIHARIGVLHFLQVLLQIIQTGVEALVVNIILIFSIKLFSYLREGVTRSQTTMTNGLTDCAAGGFSSASLHVFHSFSMVQNGNNHARLPKPDKIVTQLILISHALAS